MLLKRIKPYENSLKDFVVYLKANDINPSLFFTKVNIDKQFEVIHKYIKEALWYRIVFKNDYFYLILDNPIWDSQIVYKNKVNNDKETFIVESFKYFEEHGVRAYGITPF